MLFYLIGIGHSTGLIVVATIFILMKGELDLQKLGRYCDLLVGAFMIILGSYGVMGAMRIYREKTNKRDFDLLKSSSSKNDMDSLVLGRATRGQLDRDHIISSTTNINSMFSAHTELDDESGFGATTILHADHFHDHHHLDFGPLEKDCKWLNCIDMRDPFVQRVVSFSIGLLHGVAGPGDEYFPSQLTVSQTFNIDYIMTSHLRSCNILSLLLDYRWNSRRVACSGDEKLGLIDHIPRQFYIRFNFIHGAIRSFVRRGDEEIRSHSAVCRSLLATVQLSNEYRSGHPLVRSKHYGRFGRVLSLEDE